MKRVLKHLISHLTALPRWSVLAGAMTVIVVVFCWQMVGLIAIQRGDFIDDNTLKLKLVGEPTSGIQLEQIATLHLFGDVAANIVVPPPPNELPKTDLKLILVGAMTDSDPQKASALIQADSQTRRFYVGDNIPGGAVLHEVLDDAVVLKRDSRYETLPFPKAGDTPGMTGNLVADRPVARTGSANVAKTVIPGQPAAAKNTSLREKLQGFPAAGHSEFYDQ